MYVFGRPVDHVWFYSVQESMAVGFARVAVQGFLGIPLERFRDVGCEDFEMQAVWVEEFHACPT